MATYAFTNEGPGAMRGGRCHPMAGGPGGRHGGPGPFGRGQGRFGGPFDHPDRQGGGPFGPDWGGGPPWGGGGPRGRGGPGGRRGRGPRASRGDIRAGILVLLGESPMHGYQIMRELSERSGGAWRPSPGSVYPQLSQLQDEGLVSGEEKAGGRRLFSLTDDGQAELASREGQKAPWETVSEEESAPALELRGVVFQVLAAAKQVVGAGTDEQVKRAIAVLKDTRRSLYRILAEDEPEEGSPEAPTDPAA